MRVALACAIILLLGTSVANSQRPIGSDMGCGSCGHGAGTTSSPSSMNTGNDYQNGLIMLHRQKYEEAIKYLNNAHSDAPHNADILNYLGYAHHMLGEDEYALDLYKRAIDENPDHKLAHQYLGELYLSMKDLPSAQAQLAELARLCPDSCSTRDTLASEISTYQLQAGNTPVATKPAGSN